VEAFGIEVYNMHFATGRLLRCGSAGEIGVNVMPIASDCGGPAIGPRGVITNRL
jgi:hypothetical protein